MFAAALKCTSFVVNGLLFLKSRTTSTSIAFADTDELVAVAEGILGQRVTWEGFEGGRVFFGGGGIEKGNLGRPE